MTRIGETVTVATTIHLTFEQQRQRTSASCLFYERFVYRIKNYHPIAIR